MVYDGINEYGGNSTGGYNVDVLPRDNYAAKTDPNEVKKSTNSTNKNDTFNEIWEMYRDQLINL